MFFYGFRFSFTVLPLNYFPVVEQLKCLKLKDLLIPALSVDSFEDEYDQFRLDSPREAYERFRQTAADGTTLKGAASSC